MNSKVAMWFGGVFFGFSIISGVQWIFNIVRPVPSGWVVLLLLVVASSYLIRGLSD